MSLAPPTAPLKGLGVRGIVLEPFNPMTLASEITAILSG
jgi:hypothetical protein